MMTYDVKDFKSNEKDVLAQLYDAWHFLPICDLFGVIGGAIQELQYYRQKENLQDKKHLMGKVLTIVGKHLGETQIRMDLEAELYALIQPNTKEVNHE